MAKPPVVSFSRPQNRGTAGRNETNSGLFKHMEEIRDFQLAVDTVYHILLRAL